MRIAALTCFLLAVLLAGFAYWGIYTAAGVRAFDEMAGIIPFWAALLSMVLALCAAGLGWLGRRSRRGGRRG